MAVYGFMLSLGRGGLQDHAAGVHWLQKAADRGVLAAHYGLAGAYGAGRGARRDPVKALTHLLIAGLDEEVPMASFEELQAILTSEQIVEAEKAAAAWRPGCLN